MILKEERLDVVINDRRKEVDLVVINQSYSSYYLKGLLLFERTHNVFSKT